MTQKEYLILIKQKIFDAKIFKKIEGILITGSIGRGDKYLNDDYLNDIDIIVVADELISIERKRELEKELNILMKTKFTDIFYINRKKFFKIYKKSKIEQTYYDILKGNILLFETTEFKNLFKKFKEKSYEILKRSAYSNYCTRIWCLIGPYVLSNEGKIILEDTEFGRYQIKKAMSSIIDATLILDNKYKNIKNYEKLKDIKKTSYYFKYPSFYEEILSIYKNLEILINYEKYLKVLSLYIKFGEIILKNKILFYELIKERPHIILRKNNLLLILKYVKRYKYLKKIYNTLTSENKKTDLRKYILYFKN